MVGAAAAAAAAAATTLVKQGRRGEHLAHRDRRRGLHVLGPGCFVAIVVVGVGVGMHVVFEVERFEVAGL